MTWLNVLARNRRTCVRICGIFWQFSSRIDGLYSLYYVHYSQKWQEKAYIHMYVTITT